MKRKILGGILGVLFAIAVFSGQCLAMQMSQPVKIGSVSRSPVIPPGSLRVEGASFINEGKYDTNVQGTKKYKKGESIGKGGMARFGHGEDVLWVHSLGEYGERKYRWRSYDWKLKIGGRDTKNTFELILAYSDNGVDAKLYKISTDAGITLYAVSNIDDGHMHWMILGCKKDGTFVKYIDTENISKQYFKDPGYTYVARWQRSEHNDFFYGNGFHTPPSIQGDTIVMKLVLCPSSYEYHDTPAAGEFRFKWDDAAQWFGVEYVPYNN